MVGDSPRDFHVCTHSSVARTFHAFTICPRKFHGFYAVHGGPNAVFVDTEFNPDTYPVFF
jgi:hypothetical protein